MFCARLSPILSIILLRIPEESPYFLYQGMTTHLYCIQMHKDFDEWNKIKKETDASENAVYFRAQEVWWIKIGLNIGIESTGKGIHFTRPVLILKKHNKHSCLVVSLTTSSKLDKSKVCLDPRSHEGVFVKLTQIKTIDSKRLVKKMFFIDQNNFERIKAAIRDCNQL